MGSEARFVHSCTYERYARVPHLLKVSPWRCQHSSCKSSRHVHFLIQHDYTNTSHLFLHYCDSQATGVSFDVVTEEVIYSFSFTQQLRQHTAVAPCNPLPVQIAIVQYTTNTTLYLALKPLVSISQRFNHPKGQTRDNLTCL